MVSSKLKNSPCYDPFWGLVGPTLSAKQPNVCQPLDYPTLASQILSSFLIQPMPMNNFGV